MHNDYDALEQELLIRNFELKSGSENSVALTNTQYNSIMRLYEQRQTTKTVIYVTNGFIMYIIM